MPHGDRASLSREELIAAIAAGKATDGRQVFEPDPGDDPDDLTVASAATDPAGHAWMWVEHVDDSDFDLDIGFSDTFAVVNAGAMNDAVAFLRTLPGVSDAFEQDPGQILVTGTRDASRVMASLIAWWRERS